MAVFCYIVTQYTTMEVLFLKMYIILGGVYSVLCI